MYAIATGTANTYAVTLNSVPTAYTDGMVFSTKINIDAIAASTINVNGLGAKPLKKTNGNDVTNLKANGIYSFRYNVSTSTFILQGEGGEYGNATPAEVLYGYSLGTENGVVNGSLVLSGNASDGDVLSGKTYYSTDAKTKRTGNLTPNHKASGNGLVNIPPLNAPRITINLAFMPKNVSVFVGNFGANIAKSKIDGADHQSDPSSNINTFYIYPSQNSFDISFTSHNQYGTFTANYYWMATD